MVSHEPEYQKEPAIRESIERRILLDNLRRMQAVLLGLVIFLALALLCSRLLHERALEDFGSILPLRLQNMWRSLWLAVDLLALFIIHRILARTPERITFLHSLVETGVPFVNMLFVVAMLGIGYTYNPSLEALYIALFALAPVIRLNAAKTFVAVVLPCLLLLAMLLGRDAAGVAHVSNIISIVAITILAVVVFRVMYLSGVREMMQQAVIERQLKAMEDLANTDALTRLANRRRLDEYLEREWRRTMRGFHTLAVVMFDIDLFKSFNDVYGHLAGDECIQAIGRIIGGHARRAEDMAARYGGEEFVLVLPGVDIEAAADIAENVRRQIVSMGRLHAGSPEGRVTVSAGVASSRLSAASSGTELLSCADDALYYAKSSGRNRVALADDFRKKASKG